MMQDMFDFFKTVSESQIALFNQFALPVPQPDEFTFKMDPTKKEINIFVEGEWITLVDFVIKYKHMRDGLVNK